MQFAIFSTEVGRHDENLLHPPFCPSVRGGAGDKSGLPLEELTASQARASIGRGF
jgi:hypothetical protein